MYKTNIDRLDSAIGGLNNGKLITIGGRPATGKTTTVIDIMNNISEQVDNWFIISSCGLYPISKFRR